MYYAYDPDDNKVSTKGISKETELSYDDFYNCLYNDISNEIVNTGFRIKDGNMHIQVYEII